jgi:tetratricopeptide (TPR) repeat protein
VSALSNKRIALAMLVLVAASLGACTSTAPRPVEQAATVPADAAMDADPAVSTIPPAASDAFARAVAAMDAGRWLEAEQLLEALVETWPDYPGPFVNLAIIYRQDGREMEAEGALERALAVAPNHPAANNQLGMLERERGEFTAAEVAYRRALAQAPDYALAHYNLAVLLDLYLYRNEEALRHYEAYQALTLEPDPTVDLWVADLRRRLGVAPEDTQLAQGDGS